MEPEFEPKTEEKSALHGKKSQESVCELSSARLCACPSNTSLEPFVMGRSFPLDYLSLEWLSLGVEAGGRRRMRVDDRAGTRSEKRGGARSMRMRRCGGIQCNQDSCFGIRGITPNTKTYILVYPLLDTCDT